MKKTITIMLICVIIWSNFASCGKVETVEKHLSSSNITDYVNIQVVFGEVTETTFTSCMCYVIVSPKGDYKFENASLSFDFNSLLQNKLKWHPVFPNGVLYDYATILLDKNGYGVASVYFEKSGNERHPSIVGEWKPNIFKVTGKVYFEKQK